MYISAWHLETRGLFLFPYICEIYSDFSVPSCKPYKSYLSIAQYVVHTTSYYKVEMEKIIFLEEMRLMYTKKSRHRPFTSYVLKPVLSELNGFKILL